MVEKAAASAAPAVDWLGEQGKSLNATQKKLVTDTSAYIAANPLVSVGVAVLAGFVMPEVYIKNVATKRREILNYVLPEGLDLLTICVEAGLSVDAAFRRTRKFLRPSRSSAPM